LVDEIEQRVVGPLQVFEDEHERALVRERLDEASPGGEALTAFLSSPVLVGGEAEERPQMRRHPSALAFRKQIGEDGGELLFAGLAAVGAEQADLGLHDLAERPEADAFAVGKRAPLPPRDELPVGVDGRVELADEPALA